MKRIRKEEPLTSYDGEMLEELTGKAVDDQVLEKIFSEFCLGK